MVISRLVGIHETDDRRVVREGRSEEVKPKHGVPCKRTETNVNAELRLIPDGKDPFEESASAERSAGDPLQVSNWCRTSRQPCRVCCQAAIEYQKHSVDFASCAAVCPTVRPDG
jgi:hypothetical protein